MATIKDVAQQANVGLATVSRVLNGAQGVSPKTKRRVLKAIDQLGYVPNASGRLFKSQRTGIISILVPDISQMVYSCLIYYLSNVLAQWGYMLIVNNSQGSVETEKRFLELLRQNRFDSAILISDNNLSDHIGSGLPVVTLDAANAPGLPCIASDNEAGGRLATEYLLQCGCKKLGFLGPELTIPSEVNGRWRAFEAVCRERGADFVRLLLPYRHGEEMDTAQKFLERVQDCDGIFAASDYIAYSLIKVLQNQGVQVPQDVQIVGFDGVPMSGWSFAPDLTTVEQNIPEMAHRLAISALKLAGVPDTPPLGADRIPVRLHIGMTTRFQSSQT